MVSDTHSHYLVGYHTTHLTVCASKRTAPAGEARRGKAKCERGDERVMDEILEA